MLKKTSLDAFNAKYAVTHVLTVTIFQNAYDVVKTTTICNAPKTEKNLQNVPYVESLIPPTIKVA